MSWDKNSIESGSPLGRPFVDCIGQAECLVTVFRVSSVSSLEVISASGVNVVSLVTLTFSLCILGTVQPVTDVKVTLVVFAAVCFLPNEKRFLTFLPSLFPHWCFDPNVSNFGNDQVVRVLPAVFVSDISIFLIFPT